MPKIISALQAHPTESRAAFQARALDDLAPECARIRGVRKLTLNIVQEAPSFMPIPRPNPAAPPVYDAVMMAWLNEDAFSAYEAQFSGFPGIAHHYLVDEIVERDELPLVQGKMTEGIKNIPLIVAQKQHGDAARREKWKAHGELGLRIHTGMRRYVRNIVDKALTPNAPLVHGIGEVCFPTIADLQFGQFPKPEDRQAFLDDIAGWVEASTSHYATEKVLERDMFRLTHSRQPKPRSSCCFRGRFTLSFDARARQPQTIAL